MGAISDIIAFLVIAHSLQRGKWIKNWHWQYTREQKANLIHSESRSKLLEANPQTNQEVMSQSSVAGKLARDSITRRNAKSQTIGPLLPSLIVARTQSF